MSKQNTEPDIALVRRVGAEKPTLRLEGLYTELTSILPDGQSRLRPIPELRWIVLNALAITTIAHTYSVSKAEVVERAKEALAATANLGYKARITHCIGSRLVGSAVVYPEVALGLKGPRFLEEVSCIDGFLRATYPKAHLGEYRDAGVPLVPAAEGIIYGPEVYTQAASAVNTAFPAKERAFLNLLPLEQI